MKNKKSKIVAPALGLILLSTAASISGSVAWFTAQRTGIVKAGEFAVVKTSDNLAIELGAGVGTTVLDSGNAHTVTTKTDYVLTDASFDHTVGALNVVTPDAPREKVLRNDALSTLGINDAAAEGHKWDRAEGYVNRGTNTYSAFTWTMKFTVSFSGSATKKQGLFLDLSSSDTYMHEKVHFAKNAEIPQYDAEDATKPQYFKNEDLSDDGGAVNESTAYTVTDNDGEDLYTAKPSATGKAFRIAFVPTLIEDSTNGSVAYAKVWADNEGSVAGEGKFIDGAAVGNLLESDSAPINPTAYATETGSWSYVTDSWKYSSATAGNGTVLMKSGDDTPIPQDNTADQDDDYYLGHNSNYLGFFNVNPGNSVSITFTCVAWYEGSHPQINKDSTDFEDIVTSMKFGVSELIA